MSAPDLAPREPRAIDRRMVALAVPAVGALVADPLLGVVDTIVAGRVSTATLGALGLGVSLLTAGTWLFNFLVVGTTTGVARSRGGGDDAGAGRSVAHAVWVAGLIGIVVATALALAAPTLVRLTGAVDALVEPATTYLRIRAVGLPLVLLGMVGHGALRGVGDTRTPLLVVVVANVVNGALDVVLVFVLDIGLEGIAWATVVAEAVALVMLVAVRGRTGLVLSGHGRPRLTDVSGLLVVSRDMAVRTGGLLLGFTLVATAAARVDVATAAGHQVLWQVYILAAFVQDSIAVAGQTMIGTARGRDDAAAARAIVARLTGWGLAVGVVTAVLLAPLGGPIARLVTDDAAALATVAGAAWLVGALAQVPGGPAFVLDGVLMGAEDWGYLRTWTATPAVVAGVAAQLVVANGGGLAALWLCIVGLNLARAIALLARVRSGGWARAVTA